MGEETDKSKNSEIGAKKTVKKIRSPVQSESNDCDSEDAITRCNDSVLNHNDNDENLSVNLISDKDKTNGESSQKEFRVKPTNKEFKVRLVPLERLLSSAKKASLAKEKISEPQQTSTVGKKILPARSIRKNYSIIEISSSSSSSEDEVLIIPQKRKEKTSVSSASTTTKITIATQKVAEATSSSAATAKDSEKSSRKSKEKFKKLQTKETTSSSATTSKVSENSRSKSNEKSEKLQPKETTSSSAVAVKDSEKSKSKSKGKSEKSQPKETTSSSAAAAKDSENSNSNSNEKSEKSETKSSSAASAKDSENSRSKSNVKSEKSQPKETISSSAAAAKDSENSRSKSNGKSDKSDTTSSSTAAAKDSENSRSKSNEKSDKSDTTSSSAATAKDSENLRSKSNGKSEKSQLKEQAEVKEQEKEQRLKRCVVRLKRIPWPRPQKNSIQPEVKPETSKANEINGRNRKRRLSSSSSSSNSSLSSSSSSCSSSSSTETSTAGSKTTMERQSVAKKSRKSSSDSDSDFEMSKEIAISKQKNSTDDDNDDDDAKSTDSEVLPTRKRRVFKKNKSESDGSDFEPKAKRPPKAKIPRRRIKHGSDDSDDDDDDSDKEKNKHKRKDIRKIIKTKDLDVSTKEAAKIEDERRKRIEERQKLYNQIYERPETEEITELVLDFDEESKEPLLKVDSGLLKKLKPHQVTGVKFMWDACFETLGDAIEKPGSGCILAHCMGLGKTLQIVTLSHTLLSHSRKTHVERVLIISPLSTLNNWAREFKQWMSFARKKNIEIYDMSRYKDKNMRIFKLKEWFDEGGVCIMGYDLYRILSNEKAKGLRKKQREDLQQALVDPGADLVVCDEGHLLKNEKTSISKAVTRMRTRRRIVLTGTPLQNNLKEYYCMIQFIKPNLLGTYKEYLNRFVNPITNGQYTDSTERDIRLMRHRSHILHKLLEGCIQRRDYSVLSPYLPPKHEYVVYTTLSELQQQLYDYYMTTHRDVSSSDICGKGARLFQDFQDLRRIWTHPMSLRVNSDIVIRKRLLADDEDSLEDFICDDEDEDDAAGGGGGGADGTTTDDTSVDSTKSFASGNGGNIASGSTKPRKTRLAKQLNGGNDSDPGEIKESEVAEPDDPSEWWKRFVDEAALNNLNHSPKLVMLMKLLQQCETIGDKLLVFSQSLQSLDVIEHFLSLIDRKTNGEEIEGDVCDIKGRWKVGQDYFRLDGSCSVENREDMCKRFNNVDNLRARLFLISTRAGGLGINLVAANRVVIFDVSWNPSHDTQSIFRVYRFGQNKPCYIYRLIAMGTMEQKVYERQVTKQATAKRVIDEQQISRHYNQSDLQELYSYELKPMIPREIPILPKDRLFAELLSDYEKLIFKYHEHDSLLENEDSENLSEEDRKAAWSEYEAEKTRATQTAQYIAYDRSAYAQPTNTGTVTSSRIFGFRTDVLLQLLSMKVAKDNPEFNQNQITQLVPGYLDRLYNEMNNNDPSLYRELLNLNTTLIQPGGMYMNPLLYANQNPQAAGYYQAPHIQQQPQPPGMLPLVSPPQIVSAAPGFKADEVYEID